MKNAARLLRYSVTIKPVLPREVMLTHPAPMRRAHVAWVLIRTAIRVLLGLPPR